MKKLYFLRLTILLTLLVLSGRVFSQTAGDYRSFATGNWSAAASWERFDGAVWQAAATAPSSSDGVITIRSGHTITIIASVTMDQTIIENGGALTINPNISGISIPVTVNNGAGDDLTIDGSFSLLDDGFSEGSILTINSNSSVVVSTNGTFAIQEPSLSSITYAAGSTYQHARNAGAIPASVWSSTSNCLITGINNIAPTGLDQAFGNFTWNCTGQTAALSLAIPTTTIAGDFQILSTNGFVTTLNSAGTAVIQVNGNMDVSGNSRFATTNTGNVTLRVMGNFNYSSSATSLLGGNNVTTVSVLDIRGNFTHASGTLSKTGTNGTSTIVFGGSGVQTYTVGTLTPISTQISYQINNGSTLDLQTYAATGTGTFTVNSGGTVRVGSTDGGGAIQAAPASAGNIRTTNQSFASGSTIIYNGGSAQSIGTGHPSGSGINTAINNSAGVTLVSDVTIGGNLTLTSGNLSISNFVLTLNGGFTPNSNFLSVTSSSDLVINGTGAFGTLAITGGPTISDLTINRTSSGSVTLGTALTIGGTLTQTAGDIILNGNTLTLSGAYSRTGGDIVGNSSSTLIVNGTGALPSPVPLSGSFNTLTLDRASSTLSSSSSITVTNLNLTSGTFSNSGAVAMASGGTLTRADQGSITGVAPTTSGSYNVVYNVSSPISTGIELPAGTTQLNSLTKNGSSTLTLASSITVNGVLTFADGIFNAGANTLDIKGNVVSGSTSQLTSSTITFSGTTAISGGTTLTFGNFTVSVGGTVTPSSSLNINGNLVNNGTLNSGSGTVTFGGTTTVSGSSTSSFNNLVINASSTLTAHTGTMNVAGSWSNNGTFNHNNGTIAFNGTTSINGSSSTNFFNISVAGSSTLNAPATLNIAGNFTDNGTFNRGTGTVVFNGSGIQNIQGSAATEFNNISVTNTASTIRVETNKNLNGVLTLSSGSTFDADGTGSGVFTLRSTGDNPVADAGIASLPAGASVTGNVTVQRYMAIEGPNSRIYRFISSPVQSPATSQLQTEIPITGTFTGASTGCSGCGSSPSMYTYNETVTTGDANAGYVAFPVASNAETLTPGMGYSIFVRGNVDPIASAGSARWDVRAAINSGTVNLPVSFTSSGILANDGWNLVGNPYPSAIDWDAAGWTRSNLTNAIYTKDNGQGVYATYINGVEANGGTRYIAMGQGFFVKSDGGSPVLQATENVKVAGQSTTFFREKSISNIFRIVLVQGKLRDESVIRFTDNATAGFDKHADAYKLDNTIFNLSSVAAGDIRLAINSLPEQKCGNSIKLDVGNVTPGTYSLEFSQIESFDKNLNIYVSDARENKIIDVRQTPAYSFTITADPATFGSDRFTVIFSQKKVHKNDLSSMDIPSVSAANVVSCNGSGATLKASGASEGNYRWYNSENDVTPVSTASSLTIGQLNKTKTFYVAGVNSLGCESKRVPVIAEYMEVKPVTIATKGKKLVSNYTEGNQWYFNDQLLEGETGHELEIAKHGKYEVRVAAKNCMVSALYEYLSESASPFGITLYPNPSKRLIHLNIPDKKLFHNASVYSAIGVKVGEFILEPKGEQVTGVFDISDLPAGIYTVKFSGKNKIVTLKVIKE